ncbi:MAG TPA: hypothetical protein VIL94_00465 [Acidothermaceae bacterium]|jgi:hypothetical protein
MSGYLTDWLAKEHVAELRSQAARRQWRVDVKRARAEVGAVAKAAAKTADTSTVDRGGALATAGRSTETAVYCHRAAAPVRQSTSV